MSEVVLNKDPRDVIIAPVVSEKSYALMDDNKYTFIVHPSANKTEVKLAVEQIFGVKVAKKGVNILNREGKRVRTRFGYGKRANQKRAIVTLRDGDRIDVFGV